MGAWMVDRGRIVSLGQVPSQSLAAAGGDTQSVVSPRGEGGGVYREVGIPAHRAEPPTPRRRLREHRGTSPQPTPDDTQLQNWSL